MTVATTLNVAINLAGLFEYVVAEPYDTQPEATYDAATGQLVVNLVGGGQTATVEEVATYLANHDGLNVTVSTDTVYVNASIFVAAGYEPNWYMEFFVLGGVATPGPLPRDAQARLATYTVSIPALGYTEDTIVYYWQNTTVDPDRAYIVVQGEDFYWGAAVAYPVALTENATVGNLRIHLVSQGPQDPVAVAQAIISGLGLDYVCVVGLAELRTLLSNGQVTLTCAAAATTYTRTLYLYRGQDVAAVQNVAPGSQASASAPYTAASIPATFLVTAPVLGLYVETNATALQGTVTLSLG